MQVHLPHEQRIVFDLSGDAQHIVETTENIDTPLMAFFKMNQVPGPIGDLRLARTLTFQEYPNHFVIKPDESNPQSKKWSPRQRNSFAIQLDA